MRKTITQLREMCISKYFEKNSLLDLATLAKEMVSYSYVADKIDLSEITFKAGTSVSLKNSISLSEISEFKIPILDALFADSLLKSQRFQVINFEKSENLASLSFNFFDLAKALSIRYFLLMTKNSTEREPAEKLPKFIINIYKTTKLEDYYDMFSINDLSNFNHDWIFLFEVKSLPSVMQNRIKLGIAGQKYVKLFSRYPFSEDAPKQALEVAFKVKKLASKGPCSLYHPIKSDVSLRFSKHLEHLASIVFSQETIERMLKDKALFAAPVNDLTFDSVLRWDDEVFDAYSKTAMF